MKGGRLATVLALGIASFFMFQGGEQMAKRALNVARKGMALWDLATIERTVQMDLGQQGAATPRPTHELLEQHLDQSLSVTKAGAEPGLDPWGNPYRFELVDDENSVYVLYSVGPDGVPGPCHDDDPASDDICVTLRF